ncbi:MAG: hypothetical protein KGD63_13490 [Candidatus Lokiarchaeota archaeon]|nr:hypothetical protein [Candidatus Lokiarchaeota archaeon]
MSSLNHNLEGKKHNVKDLVTEINEDKDNVNETKQQKYFLQIDVMKTLCIICVVAIHNIGKYMFPLECFWQVLQPIPLFLIISGFNFGNSFKKQNLHSLKEMYTVQYLKEMIL